MNFNPFVDQFYVIKLQIQGIIFSLIAAIIQFINNALCSHSVLNDSYESLHNHSLLPQTATTDRFLSVKFAFIIVYKVLNKMEVTYSFQYTHIHHKHKHTHTHTHKYTNATAHEEISLFLTYCYQTYHRKYEM